MKILKNIFSITNERQYKVLRILGIKLSFKRFRFQKLPKGKPTLAFHLNEMDKGGLEEVVLQLSTNKEIQKKYNVVIIAQNSNKGHLAKIAKKHGVGVYSFFNNRYLISYLIDKLNIKIVHLHYNINGVEIYKKRGVKIIYTIHNNYIWFDEQSTKERNRYYESVDKFIAVSTQVSEFFKEKFSIPNSKIEVIPNGIKYTDTSKIKPVTKAQAGFSKDDFVLINVASFGVLKYQFALIKALSILKDKYPKLKLLILGNITDFKYYKQIISYIKELKMDNAIKIKNYLPKDEVFKYLKMANCFIMTSITEGFSIAGLEAMLFNLPMILTNIGGARDIITNNDTGIIVPHAFSNLQKLNINKVIEDNKNKVFYFDNIDKIVSAIEDVYTNYSDWKDKAKQANLKVKERFNVDRVCAQYLQQYDNLNKNFCLKEFEELLKQENFEAAVFAPYPMKSEIFEGWMSRIAAIDNLLSNKKRIYFNPYQLFDNILVSQFKENEFEISVKPDNPMFQPIIDLLVKYTKISYCHTLHMAEYLVSNLNTNKIIVDIHGVTPEEEVMLGNSHLKEKYEKIEQKVLKEAKACVVVTEAMKIHYKNKYPDIKPKKYIVLPIIEKFNIDEIVIDKSDNKENIILYSGGVQVWQNLDAMLELNSKLKHDFKFMYLSFDVNFIKKKLKKLKIKNAFCKCVSKNELREIYQKANFGFMLRDESPVNFAACPTKLYDYFCCGIIPIVRSEKIGDFLALDYKFIKEEDLLNKKLPSAIEQKEMIKSNFKAAQKLRNIFEKSSEEFKRLVNEA